MEQPESVMSAGDEEEEEEEEDDDDVEDSEEEEEEGREDEDCGEEMGVVNPERALHKVSTLTSVS